MKKKINNLIDNIIRIVIGKFLKNMDVTFNQELSDLIRGLNFKINLIQKDIEEMKKQKTLKYFAGLVN